MTIFRNLTGFDVYINCLNNQYFVKSNDSLSIDDSINSFVVFLNKRSEINSRKLADFSKYKFVLACTYVLESKDNVTIEMRYNYVNGVKRDEYKYVAVTSNVPIYNTQNTIVDKSETYEMVKVVENKIKKQSKLIDVFYVFDFFRYIAPVYLFILFGIYFTVGLKVALCILIPLLLVGLLIGFIINKVGNHLLDKIDEKSKAELLYKDFNSYFDEEYISAVINTPN